MGLDGETHVVEGWLYPDCAVCCRPLHPGNVDQHAAWHAQQLARATTPRPTVRDLLGIAPDWTGGLSVDQYVRQQRSRGEDTEVP